MSRLLAGLLSCCLLLTAACGDDGGGPSRDDDARLAERVSLTLDDLGGDWEAAPGDDDDDSDDELDLPDECDDIERAFGDDDDFEGQTAEFDSDPFVRGDLATEGEQLTMNSRIAIGEDEQAVADALALFTDERLPDCLARAFESEIAGDESGLPPGAEVAPVEVTTPEPPDVGDDAIRFVLRTAIRLPEVEVPVEFSFLVLRRDRVGVQLSVSAIGGAYPEDDVEAALDAILGRIDDELS